MRLLWVGSALLGVVLLWYLCQTHQLRFDQTIQTKYDANTLFRMMENAFTDSASTEFWPNDLEMVKSKGPHLGAPIQVTYKSAIGETTLHYTISDRQERQFSYQAAPSHPLKGGGTVVVIEAEQGAQLRWYGQFSYRGFSPAAVWTKYYFSPKFFATLEKNLQ